MDCSLKIFCADRMYPHHYHAANYTSRLIIIEISPKLSCMYIWKGLTRPGVLRALQLRHLAFFTPFPHAHFCFWGHERWAHRSITKCYLKSDFALQIEKSSTSRAFHAHDHRDDSMVIDLQTLWAFCSWAAALNVSCNAGGPRLSSANN